MQNEQSKKVVIKIFEMKMNESLQENTANEITDKSQVTIIIAKKSKIREITRKWKETEGDRGREVIFLKELILNYQENVNATKRREKSVFSSTLNILFPRQNITSNRGELMISEV